MVPVADVESETGGALVLRTGKALPGAPEATVKAAVATIGIAERDAKMEKPGHLT